LNQNQAILESASKLNRILQLAGKGFVALVPALAIVVGAAWVITDPSLELFLQATIWTSGFVFLGLALESDGAVAGLSLATGLVLPVLAWLSDRVAGEYAIVAAALVAAWIAAAILRR
jgi:hypothetical protein